MMRRLLPLAPLLALLVPTAPSHAGTSSCQVLHASHYTRAKLLAVHRAQMHRFGNAGSATGPVGRVYVGRCGNLFYALASFNHRVGTTNFGLQDQPERFTRRPGGPWRDKGDTGGDVCNTAPKALIKKWGFGSKRCP